MQQWYGSYDIADRDTLRSVAGRDLMMMYRMNFLARLNADTAKTAVLNSAALFQGATAAKPKCYKTFLSQTMSGGFRVQAYDVCAKSDGKTVLGGNMEEATIISANIRVAKVRSFGCLGWEHGSHAAICRVRAEGGGQRGTRA